MKFTLTKADIDRGRRINLRVWILQAICTKYGTGADKWPQALDILDAIECVPGDRLRGG